MYMELWRLFEVKMSLQNSSPCEARTTHNRHRLAEKNTFRSPVKRPVKDCCQPSAYKCKINSKTLECMLFQLLLRRSLYTESLHWQPWGSFLSRKLAKEQRVGSCLSQAPGLHTPVTITSISRNPTTAYNCTTYTTIKNTLTFLRILWWKGRKRLMCFYCNTVDSQHYSTRAKLFITVLTAMVNKYCMSWTVEKVHKLGSLKKI